MRAQKKNIGVQKEIFMYLFSCFAPSIWAKSTLHEKGQMLNTTIYTFLYFYLHFLFFYFNFIIKNIFKNIKYIFPSSIRNSIF